MGARIFPELHSEKPRPPSIFVDILILYLFAGGSETPPPSGINQALLRRRPPAWRASGGTSLTLH